MFGWLSADAACASWTNRASASVGRDVGGQDLQRDLSIQPGVLGQIDLTHAALGDLRDDAVVQNVRHRTATTMPQHDHRRAGDARHDRAPRSDLLEQHEHGQRGDPEQVHHADDEQHAHQRPAAAEAVRAVTQPHPEARRRCRRASWSSETRAGFGSASGTRL